MFIVSFMSDIPFLPRRIAMNDDFEHSAHDAVLSAFETCLEAQLRAIRSLRRESVPPPSPKEPSRSLPDMAFDVLKEAGHPLHITELIEHLRLRFDRTVDRESLVSSLTKKVLRRDRFTRVAKNTFGLVEWEVRE
jgi:hypothetical protein